VLLLLPMLLLVLLLLLLVPILLLPVLLFCRLPIVLDTLRVPKTASVPAAVAASFQPCVYFQHKKVLQTPTCLHTCVSPFGEAMPARLGRSVTGSISASGTCKTSRTCRKLSDQTKEYAAWWHLPG
jgi:hypothetical protein